MLGNYIKIAFRHITRFKTYTAINVLGLSTGIACSLFIFMFVSHHSRFDRFHRDLDRIYLLTIKDVAEAPDKHSGETCYPSGQVLRDHFPEVEKVASVLPARDALVGRGDQVFYEKNRMFTETAVFEVLTIPFLKGDPATALDRPGTVVITEEMESKYFPGEDALGQTIQINRGDYEITGVVEDAPPRTHFPYDIFASFKTVEDRYPVDAWLLCNILNYVKLRPGTDLDAMSARLATIVLDHSDDEPAGNEKDIQHALSPVSGIHLDAAMSGLPEIGMNPQYLYFLSAIGLFILLIACINFINLNTARATRRAKEVGIRKVAGASKHQLVCQYLGESLLLAIIALVIALIIFDGTLSFFNGVASLDLTRKELLNPATIFMTTALVLFVGLCAGIYPALTMSKFKPVETLKQSMLSGPRGGALRRILVTGQFAMAVILVIGTTVIFRQLEYMKSKDLGFDKEHKIVVPLRRPIRVAEEYEEVKQDFLSHSSVTGATMSSIVPGETKTYFTTDISGGPKDGEYADIYYNFVDPDFPREYGMKLIAGRFMDRSISSDLDSAYVLNMAAVKAYGWASPEDAIGTKLVWGPNSGIVVGVVQDFHFKGLQEKVGPLCLAWRPRGFGNLTLTVGGGDIAGTLAFIEATYRSRFAGMPYDYYFLDETFNLQYESVERVSRMFGGFSLLGLSIACLGLLGLTIFMTEQRRKEIGIRKVHGASAGSIAALLTRDFLKWVLVANLVGAPISYIIMKRWLADFAYRIEIGFAIFAISAGVTVLIAVMAVGFQVAKASWANPVESLKYE